jgi:PleD family two-component response regulator
MRLRSLRRLAPARLSRRNSYALTEAGCRSCLAPQLTTMRSVALVIDLSQNKQAQGKLNHLAYHDALTDLPNQSLFKDRLKQAIALSHRQQSNAGRCCC